MCGCVGAVRLLVGVWLLLPYGQCTQKIGTWQKTHTHIHTHSEVTTTTLHLAFKLKTKGRDNVIHVHVLSLAHIGCWYLPQPLVAPTLSYSVTSKCLANYDICHFLCEAWSAVPDMAPPTPHLD